MNVFEGAKFVLQLEPIRLETDADTLIRLGCHIQSAIAADMNSWLEVCKHYWFLYFEFMGWLHMVSSGVLCWSVGSFVVVLLRMGCDHGCSCCYRMAVVMVIQDLLDLWMVLSILSLFALLPVFTASQACLARWEKEDCMTEFRRW